MPGLYTTERYQKEINKLTALITEVDPSKQGVDSPYWWHKCELAQTWYKLGEHYEMQSKFREATNAYWRADLLTCHRQATEKLFSAEDKSKLKTPRSSQSSIQNTDDSIHASLISGLMLMAGLGCERDNTAAFKLFDKTLTSHFNSSGQDVTSTLFIVGWMYAEGRGVPQNNIKAVHYYTLAAQQGHARAQHKLGWMYAG